MADTGDELEELLEAAVDVGGEIKLDFIQIVGEFELRSQAFLSIAGEQTRR